MNQRIHRLRETLNKKGIDSLILFHPANISYLAGFPAEDSYIFINKKESLLITDFRYLAEYQNKLTAGEIKLTEIDKSLLNTLKKIDKKLKIKNLAFEERHISYSFYKKLKSIFNDRLIPDEGIIEEMRIIKDSGEIKYIKKATEIALDTLQYIYKILKPGIKETEVA
ncbi:MAG: aminopeptidase P family protein, partial [Candidatus Omnitrophica bacterium]|nr:aminopeptidase P family protein [Candidatus Omnitrophota bacterium]